VTSASKLKRLDAVSKSPIFAHFSETLNGISTIKAYKAEERFTNMLVAKVDENSQFIYPAYAGDRLEDYFLNIF
jgi:ATP-binding cassette subfamily C (CFTR/MRP) protein 1